MHELIFKDGVLSAQINYGTLSGKDVQTLEQIVIPDSCIAIDETTFNNCINLKEIVVGEKNTEYASVDGVLFSKDLKRIIKYPLSKNGSYEIPDSVEVIEKYAFCNCSKLSHIKIPESVTCIREFAFANCNNLSNVFIHGKTETIESNAFFGCLGLKTFKMHPDCNAKAFITHVLFCCCNIEHIFLPDSNKRPLYDMRNLTYYPSNMLGYGSKQRYGYKDLRIVSRNLSIKKVPSDEKGPYVRGFIEHLSEYPLKTAQEYLDYFRRTFKKWQPEIINNTQALSFALNNNLIKETDVDDVLREIQETGDVERISMMMDHIQNNYGTGFDKYSERIDAKYKEAEKKIRQQERAEKRKKILEEKRKDPKADLKTVWTIRKGSGTCALINYKGNAEHLIIPSTYEGRVVTEIKKTADTGYSSVKSITLPDTVTEISTGAFSNCENLETIHLGSGLKWVGNYPFAGCKKLREVVLPEGVNYTTKWMFRDCTNLEKIVFLNKKAISYEWDCNFLRGSRKAKVYVYEGTRLVGFKLSEDRIVRMNENGEVISKQESDTLQGMIVVHTGFSSDDERKIESVTYSCGGTIKGSVVLKTDILVYNPDYDHETTKFKRAKELNESGKNIKILTMKEFLSMAENPETLQE